MVSRRINIWMDDDKIKILKEMAEEENRSMSNYIKDKLFPSVKSKKILE